MQEINHLAQVQRFILLSMLRSEDVSSILKTDIRQTFPTYMIYKGEGRILVDNVEKAKSILQEYIVVSDETFADYYPEHFFVTPLAKDISDSFSMIRTGKLDIPKLDVFLNTLLDNGVSIINYDFNQNTCEECQ